MTDVKRTTLNGAVFAGHLVVYCLWWALSIFFGAGGHGSLFPVALFWGWALLAAGAVKPWLGDSFPIALAVTAIQIAFYGLVWRAVRKWSPGRRAVRWLPFGHLLGSMWLAWRQPLEELHFLKIDPVIAILSWISSSVVFAAYWVIYLKTLASKTADQKKALSERQTT